MQSTQATAEVCFDLGFESETETWPVKHGSWLWRDHGKIELQNSRRPRTASDSKKVQKHSRHCKVDKEDSERIGLFGQISTEPKQTQSGTFAMQQSSSFVCHCPSSCGVSETNSYSSKFS